MDLRYGREVMVGAMVLVAIAGLRLRHDVAERALGLDGRPAQRPVRRRERAQAGSPVRVSGVTVGQGGGDRVPSAWGTCSSRSASSDRVEPKTDATAMIVAQSGWSATSWWTSTRARPATPSARGTVIKGSTERGLIEIGSRAQRPCRHRAHGPAGDGEPARGTPARSPRCRGLEGRCSSAQRPMALSGNPKTGPRPSSRHDGPVPPAGRAARLDTRQPRAQRTLSEQRHARRPTSRDGGAVHGHRRAARHAAPRINRGRARWARWPPTGRSTTAW